MTEHQTSEKDHSEVSDEASSSEVAKSSAPAGDRLRSLLDLARYEGDTSLWWRDRWMILGLTVLVLIPFLGSFGLWDPWETHYGEVGRQITERHDWISTWWGSHWQDAKGDQEGAYFFSKPILLMWTMALGVSVLGVNEWGIRIGVALITVLSIVTAYSFGASVFRRRTGWIMAGMLLTTPFWYFLSHQAQTDMPFVGLMTIGLCFFMMGVFGKDKDKPADLFAYSLTFGWILLLAIPQVVLVLAGLARWRGGANAFMNALTNPVWLPTALGGAAIGLGVLLFVNGLRLGRAGGPEELRSQRNWSLAGIAAMWVPLVVVLVGALISSGRPLKALGGWFGWGPTQAIIYTSFLGFALYWTLAHPIRERRRLYLLLFYAFTGLATLAKGLLGFMLPGAVLFLYILFTREWRLLARVELLRGIPIFVAITFPWYAGMLVRHTNGFWNRFFVHDHFKRLASGVHQLDTGSFEHFGKWLAYGMFPWAAFVPAAFGRLLTDRSMERDNDETRATLVLLIWAIVAFTLFTLSSTKFHHYIFPAIPAFTFLVALAIDDLFDRDMATPWILYFAAVPLMALLAWDIFLEPATFKNLFTYKYDRKWNNPEWDTSYRWAIGLVSVPMLLGAISLLLRNTKARVGGFVVLIASSTALAVFCLHVYMPQLSATWSQKRLWDHYYEHCEKTEGPPGSDPRKHFCVEPVIAFKLNWRGETYYSQNEVIPIRDDDDFTHFLSNVEDSTFYGIMEYSRYRGEFQRKLPKRFKGKACAVYNENEKFVLAKVPCAQDDPERIAE